MKMLIIPGSGLGSRLQSMMAGITFAKHHNLEYEILWFPTRDCNCIWTDLFEPQDACKTVRTPSLHDYLSNNGDNFAIVPCLFLNHVSQPIQPEQLEKYNKTYKYMVWSGKQLQYGKLCKPFLAGMRGLFKTIPVTSKILDDAYKNCKVSNISEMIGLHIRRGELCNNPLIEQVNIDRAVPASNFIKDIQRQGLENRRFLLCTECNLAEQEIKKILDVERIVCTEYTAGVLSYKLGVQEALKSIIMLSQTEQIIASHSAFSEAAAQISGIPIRVLRWN